MLVPSWHVSTGTTLPQLISFAEKVRKEKGVGIYQFHSVDGQIFKITRDTHRAFLEYLKQHEDQFGLPLFLRQWNSLVKNDPMNQY